MPPKRKSPNPPHRGRSVGGVTAPGSDPKRKKKAQGPKKHRLEEESPEVEIEEAQVLHVPKEVRTHREVNPSIGPGSVYKEFLKGRPLESFDGRSKQGEEVEAWVNTLDDYFSFIPLNEFQKAQSVTFLLTGPAKMWWDAERKLNEWKKEDITWDFMKEKIIGKYCSRQYFLGKLNEFLNLRQGGSTIEVYQDKFLALSKYGPKLSEEEIISRFIQGLVEEIKHKVEVVSPPTLAEAFRKATIYDTDVKKKGFHPSNNDRSKGKFSFEKKNSTNPNWKKLEWKKEVGERREGSSTSKSDMHMAIYQMARKLELCHRCLEKGHRVHECRSSPASQQKKDELLRANENLGSAKSLTLGEAGVEAGQILPPLTKVPSQINCRYWR